MAQLIKPIIPKRESKFVVAMTVFFFFTWLPKRLNPLIASRAAFAKPIELKEKRKYFITLIYLATKIRTII